MKTKVIFRKFRNGEVIALFPEEPGNSNYWTFMSYMHVGQHGIAADHVVWATTLATPDEYNNLKQELESIGYDLVVYKKITPQMRKQRKFNLKEIVS
jgi:hypothetical protein